MLPLTKNVEGVFQKSVQFEWRVNRGPENASVASLNLFNGTATTGTSEQVFVLNGKQPTVVSGATSDRLNATILGDIFEDVEVRYNLILEDLQFYDENTSFLLEAIFRPNLFKTAVITLVKVKGTHFSFWFCLACFLSKSNIPKRLS